MASGHLSKRSTEIITLRNHLNICFFFYNNQKEFCEGVLSVTECLESLKTMEADKSPGMDGIPFSNIIENDNHRLRELLPGANHPKYNLRRNRRFEIPRWRTHRFKNTFMMASTIKYNNSS